MYINRNCPGYDFGDTAPTAYGAFCRFKKVIIKEADCKNCKLDIKERINNANN